MLICVVNTTVYGDTIDTKLAEINQFLLTENRSSRKVDLLIEKSDLIVSNDYRSAEQLLTEALQISNDIGYQTGLLSSSAGLANIYTYYAADYFKAMQFSSSALLISKDMKDLGVEIAMHQNISFIFSSLKDIKKAITYAENAYSIAVNLEDQSQLTNLNTLLGDYYGLLKDTSKMINHYGAVLKQYKLGLSEQSTPNLLSIAKYYSLEKNIDKAGQFYDKAISQCISENNLKNYSGALTSLATFYHEIKKYNLACQTVLKAINLSDSLGYVREKVQQYRILSDVYESMGKYSSANASLNRHYDLKDSLYNEKISTQIFLFEDDFRSILKENELQLLKDKEIAHNLTLKNEALKRNTLFAGLLFVFLFALAMYSRLRVTKVLNRKLQDQKSELERLSIVASDIHNAVIILDENENIEWVNNGYSEMSGYQLEEILGIGIFNLPVGINWDEEKVDYSKQMFLTKEPFEMEWQTFRKNGDSYWLDVSVTPSFNELGELLKYIIVATDISEKKKADNELQQSYESARQLSEIGFGIAAAKSIEDIVDLVYSKINNLMDASSFGIGLLNAEENHLNFVCFIENEQKYKQVICDLSETNKMAVISMTQNKAFLVNDFKKDYSQYLEGEPTPIAGSLPKSLIYVPLISGTRAIGVLTVQSFKKNTYTGNQYNLAKSIANYMAIAVEKILLYQGMEKEVDKRTKEIILKKDQLLQTYSNTKLLSEIGLDISSTLNFEEIFETVHSKISRLMDAEMFGIRIYHEELQQIEYNYEIESGELDPLGFMSMDDKDNYTVWCIENKKDIFIKDNEIEYINYIDSFNVLKGKAPKSLIFTPMIVEGKVVGVLTVQSMRIQAFERHHLDLLKSLGAYVGSALINGSLYSTLESKVEERTEDLAEKNKNITDSINYAKRIQSGILPSENLMHTLLPKSFVFYQPKDIVSGDFYWMAEKNGKIFVAVVDCTGHGVPGAFMSIIGESLLEQAINEPYITHTNQILDFIQEGLQKLFEQETKAEGYNEIFDGMDMSLIAINMHKKRLEYSGASNSLFKVRENEVERLRGDKYGISAVDYGFKRPFSSQYVNFEAGDAFYIFSDGIPDQFGGPRIKKYGYKNTSALLSRISKIPVDKQKIEVVEEINSWKGNTEQTDDICLFGFKI